MGERLFGQPRLADPGLALDEHHAPVPLDPVVEVQERAALALASDQRRPLDGGRGGRRLLRRRGDLQGPLADRLVQRRRLGQRRHPELARERTHALAVLRDRSHAVAALGVELDQRPVGGLVERVEREPALGVDQIARPLDEAGEHAGQLAAERVGLAPLPVLEGGGVAEPDAFEQLAAELGRRRLELALARERAEAVDVDLEARPAQEADLVARRRSASAPIAVRSVESVRRSAPGACSASW